MLFHLWLDRTGAPILLSSNRQYNPQTEIDQVDQKVRRLGGVPEELGRQSEDSGFSRRSSLLTPVAAPFAGIVTGAKAAEGKSGTKRSAYAGRVGVVYPGGTSHRGLHGQAQCWGYNYFRDESHRLLEDYWNDDGPQGWAKFERDFHEMKRLGANMVRLHLQFARFIDAPGKPNQQNLARLGKAVDLAEKLGMYLDITGLGTYRLKDVPVWYRKANEKERWAMQAEFWEAVAQVCANRPAVFAYNLMNEPLATASKQPAGQWTNPTALDGQTYVEYINLDPAKRKAPDIARAWIRQMTAAIHKHDRRHLITVGLIWVTNVNPEAWSGFPPREIAPDVDFLAVHVYPDKGNVNVALKSLTRYQVGKPVVVEETFPMKCPPAEWREFLERSRGLAQGLAGAILESLTEKHRGLL